MIHEYTTKQSCNTVIKIKVNSFEWLGIICLFMISFLNKTTLLIFMILLLFLLKQKQIGAIKIMNIITLRTIINPGIAVDISSFQIFKWTILMGCLIYLLLSYSKLDNENFKKFRDIAILVLIFAFYNIFVAFIFSSLPIISIAKVTSYILPFLGVLVGVGCTHKNFNWIDWLLKMLMPLFIISFFIIKLPISYLRNGISFQGLTNHPNMFGMVSVMFFAILISHSQINKTRINKWYFLLLSLIIFYMVIISRSRTSLGSLIILVLLYLVFTNDYKGLKKLIIINAITLIMVFILLNNDIRNSIISFFYKGHEHILYSRAPQINALLSNFFKNPWFGNGFAVPVLPYRSYEFSFEFIVEPGNLILAVLSYSGIFGFIIFLSYIIKIFYVNKKNFKNVGFLPISAILVSMGEMVFFSTNNIGVWCYMLLAIYVFYDNKDSLKEGNVNLI